LASKYCPPLIIISPVEASKISQLDSWANSSVVNENETRMSVGSSHDFTSEICVGAIVGAGDVDGWDVGEYVLVGEAVKPSHIDAED
jgi:hypothetical protein